MAVRPLTRAWQGAVAAFQLLTRLPVPIGVPFDRATVAASAVFFPLAGAVIGLIAAGSGALLLAVLPPMPAAAITLAVWTALSGGLHMDGWMDTADGTLSHRSRERMLAIMKDSRVGAMGALAGALMLLVKFAALAALFEQAASGIWFAPLAAVPIWSRWWMTAAIASWPYAREGEEGMGALYRGVGASHALLASLVGYALTHALLALGAPPVGWPGPSVAGDAALSALLFAAGAAAFGFPLGVWLSRKLGGQTGDTYGAMNEWIEAGLLLALTALLGG